MNEAPVDDGGFRLSSACELDLLELEVVLLEQFIQLFDPDPAHVAEAQDLFPGMLNEVSHGLDIVGFHGIHYSYA